MKIEFEEKDKELFFSMISSQKIFGELAERLQKEDLEIPYTTIDLIISYLSKIIVDNNYFSISFDGYRKINCNIKFLVLNCQSSFIICKSFY